MFGNKSEEGIERWRKLRIEYVNCLPNTAKMIRSDQRLDCNMCGTNRKNIQNLCCTTWRERAFGRLIMVGKAVLHASGFWKVSLGECLQELPSWTQDHVVGFSEHRNIMPQTSANLFISWRTITFHSLLFSSTVTHKRLLHSTAFCSVATLSASGYYIP